MIFVNLLVANDERHVANGEITVHHAELASASQFMTTRDAETSSA